MEDRALNELWVVIPAFHEGSVIADVVREVRQFCPNGVLADDGSRDDTSEHARCAGAIVLRHPINFGQGTLFITSGSYFRSRCLLTST